MLRASCLQEEFEWGSEMCKKILDPNNKPAEWKKLFEPHSFFTKYKHYLQVGAIPLSCRDTLQYPCC